MKRSEVSMKHDAQDPSTVQNQWEVSDECKGFLREMLVAHKIKNASLPPSSQYLETNISKNSLEKDPI